MKYSLSFSGQWCLLLLHNYADILLHPQTVARVIQSYIPQYAANLGHAKYYSIRIVYLPVSAFHGRS